MTRWLRAPAFTRAASAALVAGATALAYGRLGFLGVLLVGLLILFMAVQSDLQKDGMRRPTIADAPSRTERMARDAAGDGMVRFWRAAKLVGAALAAVGFAGFAWLQLPP